MLTVEQFGPPGHPPIVLIGGSASSMDWWDTEFCTALAAATAAPVIRYDHRDTGQSPASPPGHPAYTAADLADDVLTLTPGPLHVVGVSMGGAIAQRVAIEHPGRVLSLTAIATTFVTGGPDDLPGPDDRIRASFTAAPPDWHDRAAAVDRIVADVRLYGGDTDPDTVARIYDRTRDMAATQTNHHCAAPGRPLTGRVEDITAPALIVHGTADPLFPLPHGEALAAAIPGARFLTLDGMGHAYPPRRHWPAVIDAITRMVSRTTGSGPRTTRR
jgi:pimeloyl-ACP methyl ester carboxylesterase